MNVLCYSQSLQRTNNALCHSWFLSSCSGTATQRAGPAVSAAAPGLGARFFLLVSQLLWEDVALDISLQRPRSFRTGWPAPVPGMGPAERGRLVVNSGCAQRGSCPRAELRVCGAPTPTVAPSVPRNPRALPAGCRREPLGRMTSPPGPVTCGCAIVGPGGLGNCWALCQGRTMPCLWRTVLL